MRSVVDLAATIKQVIRCDLQNRLVVSQVLGKFYIDLLTIDANPNFLNHLLECLHSHIRALAAEYLFAHFAGVLPGEDRELLLAFIAVFYIDILCLLVARASSLMEQRLLCLTLSVRIKGV